MSIKNEVVEGKIELPKDVIDIITRMNLKGYQAYAVGGCVRDSVLHRRAADWDIATNALPSEISSIFEKTVETGIEHGTVTVLWGGMAYEITTYRADSGYSDFRHPDSVSFSSSLDEDLKRRDFTVNAMAFHPKSGLIDRFGGLDDIKRKIIRAVGDPSERFHEDALRMLRAVRFSAQLGFTIEAATFEAIKRNSALIKHISIERIRDELSGILVSQNPGKISVLKQAGILSYVLPDLDAMLELDTLSPGTANPDTASPGTEVLEPLNHLHRSRKIRWAALTLMAGGNIEILKHLRLDKKTIDFISRIINSNGEHIGEEPSDVRMAASRIGKDIFPCIIHIKKAFIKADIKKAFVNADENRFEGAVDELDKINRVKKIFKEGLRKGYPMGIKDLAINGDDLLMLGIPEGESIGRVLNELLEAVVNEPLKNNRSDLVRFIMDKRL